MRSPAYYRTRSIVRWTFWVTLVVSGSALLANLLEWFTWSVGYGLPQP